MRRIIFFTVGMTILFFFVVSIPGFSDNWILNSNSPNLPADLEAKVQQAGGTLIKTLDDVGIAIADFATREEAESMETHGLSVMPDVMVNWLPQNQPQAEHIGLDEPYYGYQWHLPVIEADRAWDEGVVGTGARVAILDSGIDYTHPDLDDNIELPSSATFVPFTDSCMDDNGHGTHVAGIVAAEDNGWGCIGVAPDATLICVKVLDSNGSGNYSWVVTGIIHAIHRQADVINLSLGSTLKKNGFLPYYTASDASRLINMIKKVINWASSQGCLVVCSAGGDEMDLDHNKNLVVVPAEVGTGIAISATGPIGLSDFDRPASYTNYGQSSIWVAAPGGDSQLYPNPGWYYDMVFSTFIGGWTWMSGTSMAAPMVSGTAALVISKYGKMNAGQLKNHLANTADDPGKPGHDPYYGRGRINAYKAVTK